MTSNNPFLSRIQKTCNYKSAALLSKAASAAGTSEHETALRTPSTSGKDPQLKNGGGMDSSLCAGRSLVSRAADSSGRLCVYPEVGRLPQLFSFDNGAKSRERLFQLKMKDNFKSTNEEDTNDWQAITNINHLKKYIGELSRQKAKRNYAVSSTVNL